MNTKGTSKIGLIVAVVIISLVVGFIIGALSARVGEQATDDNTGGLYHPNREVFEEGIVLGLDIAEQYVYGKMDAGENEFAWQNRTGRTVYFDLAEMSLVANSAGILSASSSMRTYAATSTTATIADDYSRPSALHFLIDGGLIATGTPQHTISATSTDSGVGSLWVNNNEFLVFTIQNASGAGGVSPNPACDGSTCENATSTNRGFDVEVQARYHWKP